MTGRKEMKAALRLLGEGLLALWPIALMGILVVVGLTIAWLITGEPWGGR